MGGGMLHLFELKNIIRKGGTKKSNEYRHLNQLKS